MMYLLLGYDENESFTLKFSSKEELVEHLKKTCESSYENLANYYINFYSNNIDNSMIIDYVSNTVFEDIEIYKTVEDDTVESFRKEILNLKAFYESNEFKAKFVEKMRNEYVESKKTKEDSEKEKRLAKYLKLKEEFKDD